MALQLWLLRHGEAVPHGAKPDFQRELTEKGERQARAAGAALDRLGCTFAACYTSPKIRARDTARLACANLGVEVQEVDTIAGDFGTDDVQDLLHAHSGDDRVLVVGHEPDFSQLVRDLTGARVAFKKGGVAAIRMERREGTLVVLLQPPELSALAA
jgi:phosphohistidine phosphatase